MYVEMLDGRYAGQMRDIENGTALELIKLGRAKRAFGEPTHAAPIAAGGLRDMTGVNVPSKEVQDLQARVEQLEREDKQPAEAASGKKKK